MDSFTAILYGIVQGLAEFLPVSSSAHLALLPKFLKFEDPGVYFDLMMHLGTTLALLFYFWKKIFVMFKFGLEIIPIFQKNREKTSTDLNFFRNFFCSTFFSIIFILVIKQVALSYGRDTHFMAINLLVFGILLYLSDWWANKQKTTISFYDKFRFKESVLVGLAQSLAIFPGVSRSGFTITVSRFFKIPKTESAEYTFFLSIPIILLASISKLAETLTLFMIEPTNLPFANMIPSLIIGLITSFIVGIFTIHYFLKLIKKIDFQYFAIYRLIIAIIIFYVF
ncbi:MAG: undecaprenyl-diphosphate phosphatase [Oligoflexia bacterium]|nr:undecaprenyl-diphosphate phosphatase [Oligoflexia bacterium]